ncbi:S1C family serine protease [Streptomyces sp. NPDC056660]|uniref:S1C family serine protease n=1 Tax=Streptomyces sp. NPDC056660 TaxID=3345897 RepID=UPI0036C1795D
MSAKINLVVASALLIAVCGSAPARADEPSPGDHEQAKAAVVQVLGDSIAGTGFVYDAGRGLVVTTASNIAGQSSHNVLGAGEQQSVPAQLLGSDPCQDLAVLKVTPPQQGLKDLQFGDSDLVFAHDSITSLGYPDPGDATADVTATVGEATDEPDLGDVASSPDYPSVITHSVEVKPGAAGGPVLNSDGKVVGINTRVFMEEDSLAGKRHRTSSVAISSNHVKSKLADLAAGAKKNDPGWLLDAVSDPLLPQDAALAGLPKNSTQDAQKQLQDEKIDGLFLLDSRKNSPADSAELQKGAVITEVNGKDVSSVSGLCDVLEPASAGDKLNLKGIYSGVGSAGHEFGDSWTAELVLGR